MSFNVGYEVGEKIICPYCGEEFIIQRNDCWIDPITLETEIICNYCQTELPVKTFA